MDCFITDYKLDCPSGTVRAVLEDSIMQKGYPVTAGTKMLENFISPFDAEVVTRLEASGVKILGKTKMDEFGAGGLIPNAPIVASGAVTAVADGIADFALCNDYSGAVRQQAIKRGVCYIHPTYGTVSRYGLIPSVTSMDQIGIVCKTPADGFDALSQIAGHDPKDGAMFPDKKYSYEAGKSGLKIGVPSNIAKTPAVSEFIKKFDTVEFELKYFDVYEHVMRILCFAELSNNISRYDGIKFGHRASDFHGLRELYTKSRTESFGLSAKLSAIMGALMLSQDNYTRYYDKAMRIRRLIKESLEFDKYDAIILPATDETSGLALTALPQLAGLPSVTVPFADGGVSLVADVKCENVLFSALEVAGI